MAKSILNTLEKRRKREIRLWPHWESISRGRSIGFYRSKKPKAKGGNWHARVRQEDGSYVSKPLGGDIESDYSKMLDLAMEWFNRVKGVEDARYTIRMCVDDYIEHLRVEKGETPAKTALARIKPLLPRYGKVELAELTTAQVKRWRDSMVRKSDDSEDMRRSKDSANRTLSQVKAAFNHAYRMGLVGSNSAWSRVTAFKGVGKERKLFLTEEQVRALLAHTEGEFHKLVKVAVLTGCRYGELISTRVSDLDLINGSLRVSGKTGTRDIYLSKTTFAYLKEITRDKLPTAYLLIRDDGEPWGAGHQQKRMKAAVQAAKLPNDCVLYSLRHYHISRALLAGVQMQVVAENTGTSVLMLEKHYGKYTKQDRRRMMDQVDLGGV